MQLPASPAFQHCIKHYLFITTGEMVNFRLFADGNPGIVFTVGQFTNGEQSLSGSFIYGQISDFQDLYSDRFTQLMVVVLQPIGLQFLLDIPASELQQLIVPLNTIYGNSINHLEEQIFAASSPSQKIKIFESFIHNQLTNSINTEMELLMKHITRNKGMVTVKQLTEYTGWQERKLERQFAAAIGLSPKRFCDIIRLQSFIHHLKDKVSLTSASYEAGYSDQPHLIKTFKKFTGLTPTQYLSSHSLAVNFLAFNNPNVGIVHF
ncbi:AraC family transcriptional regulator [Chitinophaga silvatica]|uniref:AraC family transcriptional regulator n=1 Tax=Chitinophaga silvatica TaxID=2282649 RepID=A0A3E1YE19_9BACT|nr:helix-turn-helix domain-containing protein [Chitinophaga silvatica]RFS24738.1 AraC family transcriptional regulator [Chitinophaga silvatica]